MTKADIKTAVDGYRTQHELGTKQLQELQAQAEGLQRQLLMLEGAIIAVESLLNTPEPEETAETPSET